MYAARWNDREGNERQITTFKTLEDAKFEAANLKFEGFDGVQVLDANDNVIVEM